MEQPGIILVKKLERSCLMPDVVKIFRKKLYEDVLRVFVAESLVTNTNERLEMETARQSPCFHWMEILYAHSHLLALQKSSLVYLILIYHNVAMATDQRLVAIFGNLHNNLNTMDLTGEFEDRHFIVVRGDSRIAVTIARNRYTTKLGRENRFLIDDPESELKLAYTLSKPFKLTGTYNNHGIYKFVLQEVETTENDNQDLMIADYYKVFPRDTGTPVQPDPGQSTGGKKVWL